MYARKAAGGRGEQGWTEDYRLLYEKSGSSGSFYQFKKQVTKIFAKNSLPEFDLSYTSGGFTKKEGRIRNHGYIGGTPSLTFIKRKEKGD